MLAKQHADQCTLKGQKWFPTSTQHCVMTAHEVKNWERKKKKSPYLSVTSVLGNVSLHFNLLTSFWQGLVQRLDENVWQWIPESSESALEIMNCTAAANVLSHSIFQNIPHTHLRSHLDLAAKNGKKVEVSLLRFQFSVSVDLRIERLSSLI